MATPSSSGASYDSEVQSHFMHIFRLNQPVVQKIICTDTWAQMHSNIRHELGLSRHDVQHIHSVHHRPLDLRAANTLVVLVQKPSDLEPGDCRRIVLLDVVFHEHQADETMHPSICKSSSRRDHTSTYPGRAPPSSILQEGEKQMHR